MALLQSLARLYGAIQCLYLLSPFRPTISGGIIQTNQKYYYVGENITLHCFADTKFVDVRFTYGNDIEVPMEYVTIINDTYARMDRPAMAEDYAKTTYYCWSDFNEVDDVDTETVETEYRPQKVTNLTCIYDNMQDALCSWNLAALYKNNYYVKVATHWRATPEESWQICTTSNKTSCNIANYTQPVLYIRVSVTNTRRSDSVTTEFPDIIMKKYVKTSPVSNLQATSLNSTCIFLSWKRADSNVHYHINYSRNDAHHISYNQSNACYHGFNITSERNITVCSLCPSRNYTFVVQTKPVENGIFSDPAFVSLQMQEDGEIRKPKEPFHEWKEPHVKVTWTYERCDFYEKVIAQGYIFKICRKESSDPCKVYYIDNGSQSEFYVSHLQTQIEYAVTANTTSGLSEESDPASILLNPRSQDSEFHFNVEPLLHKTEVE